MTKLDMLNLEVKAVRSDKVHNVLNNFISKGEINNALCFTVGCLMYCNDQDREALEKIKNLLI